MQTSHIPYFPVRNDCFSVLNFFRSLVLCKGYSACHTSLNVVNSHLHFLKFYFVAQNHLIKMLSMS